MEINQVILADKIKNQNRKNDNYEGFSQAIRNYFDATTTANMSLFITDAEGLFEVYLNNLPESERQHYNCNTCKNFFRKYGALAVISENGKITSALWNCEVPEFFKNSVIAMNNIVSKSKIIGVFISDTHFLGTTTTREWNHISVQLPKEKVNKSKLKTAYQEMAEKLEDYRILNSGLLEYSFEAVNQAVTLLKTEALYRSEKCLGIAEWLKELHNKRLSTNNICILDNYIWLAVATAPVGYCHVKRSMIGTLLDDIVSGMDFESVSRRFADKMHPLRYQRPQVAPTVGNIQQAEKIVEKLGIQKSLVRRFARLEELNTIWKPKEKQEQVQSVGVFSHLIAKSKDSLQNMNIPLITMTWRKFSETVLPIAESIEFYVKDGKDNYSALLTAEHADAPPILQWDSEENRNPFSWYVYIGGSHYSKWKLSTGYCKVNGICLQPTMWYGDFSHHGKSVFFILEGAKDKEYKNSGSALFPENLKSELREIRSTIETYSKSSTILGYEESSACGIRLEYGSSCDIKIRVKTNVGTAIYKLDRWD